MTSPVLDEVLASPNLPSLPAVAVKLLELTRDPNTGVQEIAALVQQDQALSAKVLKTVNSSFYSLSSPCGSIDRALAYLGLDAVKSLVLGFSLVDLSKGVDEGFDMAAHWRRSIHGASAAREIAKRTRACDPDEAFTAGLFQDVGMLAMYATLGERYSGVVQRAEPFLRTLCLEEKTELGVEHTEAGEALTRKWNLPGGISVSVGRHHRGEESAGPEQGMIRAVALGQKAAMAMLPEALPSFAREFKDSCGSWFGIADVAEELLTSSNESASVLAEQFEVELGEPVNVNKLMNEASEAAFEMQLNTQREAQRLQVESETDGLTGVPNRRRFDAILDEHFAGGNEVAVVFLDADKFKSVNDTHGHAAGDEVLKSMARTLEKTIGPRGTVCRFGGEEFAAVLPGMTLHAAVGIGEELRADVEGMVVDLSGIPGAPHTLKVTISVGVSARDAGDPARLASPGALLQEADECVYAAKQGGRNRVVGHSSPDAGGEAPDAELAEGLRIMLVEDDPLAAMLIRTVIAKRSGGSVEWIRDGDRAKAILEGVLDGRRPRPHAIVSDVEMPGIGGEGLLGFVQATPDLKSIPVIMISAHGKAETSARLQELGAHAFYHKSELIKNLAEWLEEVMQIASAGQRSAA